MSSLRKYKKVSYLGKGSYGAAILVELRSDPNKKFVIKEIVIGITFLSLSLRIATLIIWNILQKDI